MRSSARRAGRCMAAERSVTWQREASITSTSRLPTSSVAGLLPRPAGAARIGRGGALSDLPRHRGGRLPGVRARPPRTWAAPGRRRRPQLLRRRYRAPRLRGRAGRRWTPPTRDAWLAARRFISHRRRIATKRVTTRSSSSTRTGCGSRCSAGREPICEADDGRALRGEILRGRCRRRTSRSCATSTSRGCSIEIPRSSCSSRPPTSSTSILPMRSNRVCAAGSSPSRRPCAASPKSGRNPATSSGSCTTVGTSSWPPSAGTYAAGEARELVNEEAHTWTLREGRIARFEWGQDLGSALEAAGLSEQSCHEDQQQGCSSLRSPPLAHSHKRSEDATTAG